MKQIYHNYLLWEDFQNGMWKKYDKDIEADMLHAAIEFMSDTFLFSNAMHNVVKHWKFTTEHHITDKTINHKAFLGQCGVCYELGIPEHITREAWGHLTEKKQYLANKEAKKAISLFKQNHLHYVTKTLFD
jgi:hypothetical protein